MSSDWRKLHTDCSWKRLAAVLIRAVPGGPQSLCLTLSSQRGEALASLREEFTANPTWRLPSWPRSHFPLRLHLFAEDETLIWTGEVDLKKLYFVTSDLKDLERPSELVVLLHFGEHGYFTVESLAPAACTAAQSNSDQQKTIATFCAQATPIDFPCLQEKYAQ